MKQGDIIMLKFPFTHLSTQKVRPALVLSNEACNQHRNLILAGIYGAPKPCCIPLGFHDLKTGNLKKESYISLQNVFSLEKSLIFKEVGSVHERVLKKVLEQYKSYF